MIASADQLGAAFVRVEEDCLAVRSHLIVLIAASFSVIQAELAVIVSAPALYGAVLQDGARMPTAERDLLGGGLRGEEKAGEDEEREKERYS